MWQLWPRLRRNGFTAKLPACFQHAHCTLQFAHLQMSAGSKTDVGAYHRDDSAATEENLADLQARWGGPGRGGRQWRWGWPVWQAEGVPQGSNPGSHACCVPAVLGRRAQPSPCPPNPCPSSLQGQFSLMDHRPVQDIVVDLMKEGYVPSWCTACYRKGE